MPKYYVVSGELQKIVVADVPIEACLIALSRAQGEELDTFFYVDERGFRGPKLSDNEINFDSETAPAVQLEAEEIIDFRQFDEDEFI